MPVENQQSAEEQFVGGVLCRLMLRLRKLYSHFVVSISRGSEQLTTVRDEKGWRRTAERGVPFEKPLRTERESPFPEAGPPLILPSQRIN